MRNKISYFRLGFILTLFPFLLACLIPSVPIFLSGPGWDSAAMRPRIVYAEVVCIIFTNIGLCVLFFAGIEFLTSLVFGKLKTEIKNKISCFRWGFILTLGSFLLVFLIVLLMSLFLLGTGMAPGSDAISRMADMIGAVIIICGLCMYIGLGVLVFEGIKFVFSLIFGELEIPYLRRGILLTLIPFLLLCLDILLVFLLDKIGWASHAVISGSADALIICIMLMSVGLCFLVFAGIEFLTSLAFEKRTA